MTQSDDPSKNAVPQAIAGVTSSFSLEQYYRDKLENVRRRIPQVAGQLKDAGVVRVRIQYDGCGDSGQIESVECLDADGKARDPIGQIGISEDELMDLFYDLTQARHPGWENNDGAYGEFEWDIASGALQHIHNERFTDYETTEHQGL